MQAVNSFRKSSSEGGVEVGQVETELEEEIERVEEEYNRRESDHHGSQSHSPAGGLVGPVMTGPDAVQEISLDQMME